MKILIVNTLYYPYKVGGAEVSVRLLSEELVKTGNEVTVISIHEERFEKRSVINGVNVIYLPYTNLYWQFENRPKGTLLRLAWHLVDNYNFLINYKVKKILDEFEPDVVHTNNLSGLSVAVWDAARKYKCKIVHTSRDYYLLHPNCKMYKKNKEMSNDELSVKLWSFIKRYKSRKVDAFIGISDYIKNRHINSGFFPNATSKTIYNAVPENKEKTNNKTINNITKNVGFIGRLTEEKGFDIFCELAKSNKSMNFVAAGEFDGEESKLRQLASAGNVELLGHYPVDDFMDKIELLVLPIKWQEPFGRVVIEGLAAGKSILTNKVGGISELALRLPNIYFFEDIKNLNDVPVYNEIPTELFKEFTTKFVANEYMKVYEGIVDE